jgi:hypothetical protein
MYYGARFYDPTLGRFNQPDTITSGGAQGYDRFAYVSNNPVRYNDPTGHMCSDPEDPTPTCDSGNHGGGNPPPPPPPPADPVTLTQHGKRGSGQQMKDTYDRLVTMCVAGDPSAWWCSSPGAFTLEDFMILIISGEFSSFGAVGINPLTGTTKADDPALQASLAQTAANWFSDSCLAHPNCAGPTPNAIFNWMGENLQSGQYLFNNDPTEKYPAVAALAAKVVETILSVSSTPSYTNFNSLVHWGNKSYYEGQYGKGHFPTSNYEVLGGKDPFYVIPYAEEARMCGAWPC